MHSCQGISFSGIKGGIEAFSHSWFESRFTECTISICHSGGGGSTWGTWMDLPPWLKADTHKTATGGATEVSGRHLARRGPLCVGAAGIFCFKKGWEWRNRRLNGLVLPSFLQWKSEDSIGEKVVLVVDKVKVEINSSAEDFSEKVPVQCCLFALAAAFW